MMPMWKLAAMAVALTLGAVTARAQISTSATPIYHGTLRILRPAVGTFDTSTGIGTLRVRSWQWDLKQGSNGIFPDKEPIVVALGDESFRLDPGKLERSRNGKVFRYRASTSRGISLFRIARRQRLSRHLHPERRGPLAARPPESRVSAAGRDSGRRRRLHGRRPDDAAGILAPPLRSAHLFREHLAVDPELTAA